MEEIIKKVYEQKMADGTFEKIVSANFEKMVSSVCDDLMSWNGSIKKQMKEKIEPLLIKMVESSNFNEYVVKLTTVLNECLKTSPLNQYKQITDTLKSLCGGGDNSFAYGEKVKISEIFQKYIKYVESEFEEDDFEEDEINKDDGKKTAYIECSMESDKKEKMGYFSRYNRDEFEITFNNEKSENKENTVINFSIEKDYNDKYRLHIQTNFKISELYVVPSFIVYLMSLQNSSAEIILDESSISDEANFEFEWECK